MRIADAIREFANEFFQGGTMTDLLLTLAVLLLATNLVATPWVNERIRRAIRDLTRRTVEIGLARLDAKREEMSRSVTVRREEIVSKARSICSGGYR